MTTLRAATMGGGARRRTEQSSRLRVLFEATIKGGFLLPRQMAACEHEWTSLDSGYAVCVWCGKEHWCCCGECPEEVSAAHEHVCTITGCITLEYVLRPERNASERVGPAAAAVAPAPASAAAAGDKRPLAFAGVCHHEGGGAPSPAAKKRKTAIIVSPLLLLEEEDVRKSNISHITTDHPITKPNHTHNNINYNNNYNHNNNINNNNNTRQHSKPKPPPPPPAHRCAHRLPQAHQVATPQLRAIDLLRHGSIRGGSLRELVEGIVREILASDKTDRCLEQERRRNDAKELAVFSRTLREAMHDRECLRPNVVLIAGQVAFQCRKNRQVLSLRECGPEALERVVRECTDAIAGLLLLHGGPRVARQIQNSARYREFIASMLFLMRAGISFQGRQILPRLDVLHQLLPLQVLLPQVFKIRAKSITEGENLMKMDMKGLSL